MTSDDKVTVWFFAAFVAVVLIGTTAEVLKSKSKSEVILELEKDGYKLTK